MANGLLISLLIGLPWLGALLVLIAGDRRPQQQHQLAVVFSVAAAAVSFVLLFGATAESVLTIPLGGVFGDFTFIPDGLGMLLAAIAACIGSLAVIFSVDYMKGEADLGRYYALVLFFIGIMCGLVLSGSLLQMFFFWEMTALCSYALISFYNDDPAAVAGGIKALVITSLGGVGLFMGALVTYAYTGSYQINDFLAVAETIPANVLAFVAFGFLLAAAAKSAQFPFQTWLPGAMEAPTPISALIHAATMVNAGVYLLLRFYPAFEHVPGWTTAVMTVGLVSALMAACMAVVAQDLKRILAYSTISQLGYMVYAIGVGGLFASQFHLLSHAIFKALLFLSAGAVIHAVGTRDIRLMGGLGKQMPVVRNVFVIGALALAGVPIFNGFWSKELMLEAGLHEGPLWAYSGILITTGLTALYTLRMVWLVFFGEARSKLHAHPAAPAMRFSLGTLAAGTLVSWVLAGALLHMLEATMPFHHLHGETTMGMIQIIFTTPATYVVLADVALGALLWWFRDKLGFLTTALAPLGKAAANDFGFEWLNGRIIALTNGSAEATRQTQTGILSWNIVGILGGLITVLLVLMLVWGA